VAERERVNLSQPFEPDLGNASGGSAFISPASLG